MQRHSLVHGMYRILIAVLAGALCCLQAQANLRAPNFDQHRASTVLMPFAQGLMVEEEHLVFRLGKPYTGSPMSLWGKTREAEIEATYRIHAEAGVAAVFEFVMAQAPGAVEVAINGQPVEAVRLKPEGPQLIESGPYAGRELPAEAAQIRFSGSLQAGGNEIRVRYRQPLGRDEVHYGYFTTSRWASMVAYELWPLNEWKLAPDFRMHIEVSAEDDTSFLHRLFFGSRYRLELRAQTIDSSDEIPPERIMGGDARGGNPLPGGTSWLEPGRLLLRHQLGADFPARIVAVVWEED